MQPLICTAVLAFLLGCAGVTHAHGQHGNGDNHSEQVELSMKKMQRAYRKALESNSIEQMRPAVVQLMNVVQQASALRYGINRTEQTDYQKGMQQLRLDLQQLNTAMNANNLPLAQKILTEQIKATRQKSHEALDVKKDD